MTQLEELVRRAVAGEHEAFTAVVRPEIERLYGLAGMLLRLRQRLRPTVRTC